MEGHAKRRYGEIAYLAGGSELLNEVTMLAVDAHEQYAGQKKAWTAMRRGGTGSYGEMWGDMGGDGVSVEGWRTWRSARSSWRRVAASSPSLTLTLASAIARIAAPPPAAHTACTCQRVREKEARTRDAVGRGRAGCVSYGHPPAISPASSAAPLLGGAPAAPSAPNGEPKSACRETETELAAAVARSVASRRAASRASARATRCSSPI